MTSREAVFASFTLGDEPEFVMVSAITAVIIGVLMFLLTRKGGVDA